jgi:hypothetical protein
VLVHRAIEVVSLAAAVWRAFRTRRATARARRSLRPRPANAPFAAPATGGDHRAKLTFATFGSPSAAASRPEWHPSAGSAFTGAFEVRAIALSTARAQDCALLHRIFKSKSLPRQRNPPRGNKRFAHRPRQPFLQRPRDGDGASTERPRRHERQRRARSPAKPFLRASRCQLDE